MHSFSVAVQRPEDFLPVEMLCTSLTRLTGKYCLVAPPGRDPKILNAVLTMHVHRYTGPASFTGETKSTKAWSGGAVSAAVYC